MKFRRPSPALIVACIALFVALSGTGYAVSKLPRNSVGSAQIKKNAVTSAKVKDRSLLAKDFKAGEIPAGAKGDTGAQGIKGEKGDRGPASSAGATATRDPGFSLPTGYTVMFSLSEFADSSTGTITVDTPSRLVVNGNVELQVNYIGSAYANSYCKLEYLSEVGWSPIGQVAEISDKETAIVHSQASFVGYKDVEPGTYDVRMMCRSVVSGDHQFIHGSITAVATAR